MLFTLLKSGLLETRSGRALDVSIPDITNDINSFTAHGRKVVTENSVVSALPRLAYVREALAIEIIVNKRTAPSV